MTSAFIEHATSSSIAEVETSDADSARTASSAGEPAQRSNALPGIDGIASPDMVRDAALSLDGARGSIGAVDTERAVLVWEALRRGRVTLVDWFDSDGRRLVLVKLNPVGKRCGCGLTAREYEVAMGAALGDSSKVIGYRLEISPSRVSALLKGAMRKLGVKTKAQLVIMVRILGRQAPQC